MILAKLSLQNFRNYKQREFEFSPILTLIIGPNTAGKTNIVEAIYLLATGTSFRAGVDREMIRGGEEFARVQGEVHNTSELEVVITIGSVQGKRSPYKRYLVNGVGRRKSDFVGNFYAVVFHPQDIELVTDSPSRRRSFLDNVLVQTSKEYARALTAYEKALRRRNKILSKLQDAQNTTALHSVVVNDWQKRGELEYWDKLLAENGGVITRGREEFVEFLNRNKVSKKSTHVRGKFRNIFQFKVEYDKSEISYERLQEYGVREVAAGHTLVGPHRDDFDIWAQLAEPLQKRELSAYGSRGEQRLAVLRLKLGELEYLREKTGEKPVLLLDDIFSELDYEHRALVARIIPKYQTIVTTADEHNVNGLANIAQAKIVKIG